MSEMIDLFKTAKGITEFKNPFSSDKVKSISIWIYPDEMHAGVSFKSGATSGEQRIEADTLPELLNKIQIMIESL